MLLARLRDPTHRALIPAFHDASRRYYLNGRVEEGRSIARRALDLAILLKRPRADSHYNLARAYAVSARTEPEFIARAANQLYRALVAHPLYRKYYAQDSAFSAVRVQIDAELERMPDPSDVHRRRLATMSVAKAP